MRVTLSRADVDYPNGVEIVVPGFKGDALSADPIQLFLEVYEGKLRVCVWDGTTNGDATRIVEIDPL
jgi:hypothetical protein